MVLETTLGRAAEDAAKVGAAPPSIIVIGRAVLLRQALDWISGASPRDVDPLRLGPAEGPAPA